MHSHVLDVMVGLATQLVRVMREINVQRHVGLELDYGSRCS